jgi:hypothetical protein
MALVTPAEAIRLSGRSRAAFYKDIKNGRLSKCIDVSGKTVFETSELSRVYGQLNNKQSQLVSSSEPVETQRDAERFRAMAKEIEHLRALLDSKESHIKTLQDSMRLLEYKVSQPVHPETPREKLGLLGRILGFR